MDTPELDSLLLKYVNKPELIKLSRRVLAALPNHRKFVHSVLSQPSTEKLAIILMVHPTSDPKENEEGHEEIAKSQRKVYETLRSVRPQVIGFEGSTLKHFTVRAWIKESLEILTSKLGTMTPELGEMIRQAGESNEAGFGVIDYMNENSRVFVTGIEDLDLNHLNEGTTLLWERFENTHFDCGEVEKLHRAVARMRGELGVAKLLSRMRELRVKSGALTIGVGHEDEIRELNKRYGIGSRWKFYDASV